MLCYVLNACCILKPTIFYSPIAFSLSKLAISSFSFGSDAFHVILSIPKHGTIDYVLSTTTHRMQSMICFRYEIRIFDLVGMFLVCMRSVLLLFRASVALYTRVTRS